MSGHIETMAAFADEVKRTFRRVVLCGMGGSSLAPEVLARTFGAAPGFPGLVVLDSTHPRAVTAAASDADLEHALFLMSSKSGTTLEVDCFLRYFWDRLGARGAQFAAITDPATPLETLAAERGFLRTFVAPADVGGRYSALIHYGLVPAALLGCDVRRLLGAAGRMAEACGEGVPAGENPGAWLGAVLGEAALAGRNKVTFVASSGLASFALWVEQLIAESTGKEGKGIIPVAEGSLGAPEAYGADRLFVSLTLAGDDDAAGPRLDALARAGHPVVRLSLGDRYDLGREFFRWEFATAIASAILRVNAFDQPNVAESKQNTAAVLEQRAHTPAPTPATGAELDRFVSAIAPNDYLAVLAYLPPTPDNDRQLTQISAQLRDRTKAATTWAYGPRYLHSTGQLHKGGPPIGHFLLVTDPASDDVAIPGLAFSFGRLAAAQAQGDVIALRRRGRPTLECRGLPLLEG